MTFWKGHESTKMLVDKENLPTTMVLLAGNIFLKDIVICKDHFATAVSTVPENPTQMLIDDRLIRTVSPTNGNCQCELCLAKNLHW